MFFLGVLSVLRVETILSAQFQMPDPKQMSGIPRPVTDLPDGAISVRLIRGELSNNITGHPVELHVGGRVLTAKTDDSGRAQFEGVPAGTVKAVAVVDGERLESQEFPAPAQGGVRLMLVATDTSKGPATTPNAPPIAGQVALGPQSRIVVEPGDEAVRIFYLLDIENTARAPVTPPAPFAFDTPTGAVRTTIMQGSSPLAAAEGRHVIVQSPFPPGHTFVQVAYELPSDAGAIDIAQAFPASLSQLAVVVKKVGQTILTSPQIANQRELPAEGEMFIAATGGVVSAGQTIALAVSGFPHHSRMPRVIALTLSAAIVLVGVWASGRPAENTAPDAAERKRMISRREKLFADLIHLEHDRRTGRADDRRYADRREALVAALEQVYGALET